MTTVVKKERISPANSMHALQGAGGGDELDEIQEKIILLCGEYPKGAITVGERVV